VLEELACEVVAWELAECEAFDFEEGVCAGVAGVVEAPIPMAGRAIATTV
jgi:hypothetical protein